VNAFKGIWFARAAEWAVMNPTPPNKILCLELDTGRIKRGDGMTAYADLRIFAAPDDMGAVRSHDQVVISKILTLAPLAFTPQPFTKDQVGLDRVDNIQQISISAIDTDGSLSTVSDQKIPSIKAVKRYIDDQIATVKKP